jgi:XRE family aerobic/anaerobic benzoate catabolism transcriptional regulator
VEAEAGMAIGEIFATHGEEYFHRLEVSALRRLLAGGKSAVLATGGGIVESSEARMLLEERMTTVWLRASTEEHWTRVVRQGDARPMAGRPAAKAELRRLLARRAPSSPSCRHREARHRRQRAVHRRAARGLTRGERTVSGIARDGTSRIARL